MPVSTEEEIVRFGGDAPMITIRKAWFDNYGVTAADLLRVVADDVVTVHPPKPAESSVTLTKLSPEAIP